MISRSSRTTITIISCALLLITVEVCGESLLDENGWSTNGFTSIRYQINGTKNRNNPLRHRLSSPFSGEKLYVKYSIRYDADSIDLPNENDGEFLVLWMDSIEGGDFSTHSSGVPNVGIHVSGDENRFMVRYESRQEKYSKPLEGDKDYLIVACLSKSINGENKPFDQLSLWVNPASEAESSPDVTVDSPNAISQVSWVGFSTGRKTEVEDLITVWDIDAAQSWEAILGLPLKPVPPSPAPEPTVAFSTDVLPILKENCFECHSGSDPGSGTRLDLFDEVLNQTTPRDASKSHLFELVLKQEMPPEGKSLSVDDLAVLETWINEGLAWNEELLPTPVPQSDHWSFQQIERPEIPQVENENWVKTPIDAFILAKLEGHQITPAPEAEITTLNRRLSLDLLGLPPEVHSAHKVFDVDELLEQTAYGERWARYWLDLARWAESNGHQHNRHREFAWKYRDWVIEAFNKNLPYDQFIRMQIAGDEIAPYSPENLIATGFLSSARYSGNELDKEIQRNDILVDITNTTSKVFLGLTMECAQCHTHKFDPITIRDYYRFQAYFIKGQPNNVILDKQNGRAKQLIQERWQIFDTVHARMVEQKRRAGHPEPIYVIPKSVIGGMQPSEKKRFQELELEIAQLNQTWAFFSPEHSASQQVVAPHEMRWPLSRHPETLQNIQASILIRGDVKSRGPVVKPGWPIVFGNHQDTAVETPRLSLANWLTNRRNPLTARIWVNRLWQWHFGKGLVSTSSDWGKQGTLPTHPELLDFLASELIENNWDTRHIQRMILNSATYRQSSQFSEKCYQVDPENQLYWRWQPRRLEAEAIRDSVLFVSDQLDRNTGGPSDENSHRRSIYQRQRRGSLPHQQVLFDSSAGIVSCSRRRVSTTSLQPLWLLNSQFMQSNANAFADRVESVSAALKVAYGREPTENELITLTKLAEEQGLKSACLAILNSSEFLYIP